MGYSQRENARFSLKWGFDEGKTCDFRLNVGFLKRKLAVFASMGDLRKRVIFGLNVGFSKGKRVIFWLNGGFEKTHDFRVKWGILEEKTLGFLV